MQATNARINPGSFLRIGLIIGVLAIAVSGYKLYYGTPETNTATDDEPVAQSQAQPETENTTISRGDAYLYTSNDQVYRVGGLECTYADEVGLQFCERMVKRTIARASDGYYAAHAPAGWCNATDCPPMLAGTRPVEVAPVAVQETALGVGHYPRGVGVRLQDWMQGNLP
jgi:hypothetical protein